MTTYEAILPLQLKALKLGAFHAHWKQACHDARTHGWAYNQYLSHLCDLESTERENRRLQRYLKAAGLPIGKTLASFDFKANPSIESAQIQTLAESSHWVQKAENVLIFGPSGVGKSHLAAAISYRQIELGQRAQFMQTTHLVQQLQQAKTQFQLQALLLKLDRIPLLVLDDIGYVKKDEQETSVLFELICHRYESGSLIITANQSFSEWDHIFPDNMMTVASVDRLVHHATIINIEGESYRVLDKKKQLKKAKISKNS